METYFEYGGAEGIPHYNCSWHNKTNTDYSHAGVRRPNLGITFIIGGAIVEIAYSFILLAMAKSEILKISCYKIMFLLGIYDMLATTLCTILTGYFYCVGSVYCMYPNLTFVAGLWCNGFWCGACLCALILVFNRVLELWRPHLMEKIFGGYKTLIWCSFPIMYTIYFVWFPGPVLFNSSRMAWFFDPFIYGDEVNTEETYKNYPHTTNNVFVVSVTTFLYGFLFYVLFTKFRGTGQTVNWSQISIIIQACLICSANLAAGLVYAYMQYFPITQALVFIGHLGWMLGHAMPIFVYILINRTIRREVALLLGFKKTLNTVSDAAQSNKYTTGTVASNNEY